MKTTDKIEEAMFELLVHAPDAQVAALRDIVREFKTKYPRSYRDVMARQPIARAFFDGIEGQERYENGCDVAAA